jgi:beta-galactosidase
MDNVKIGNTLRDRAQIIRESDPLHRPVFAHLGSWNIGSGKDWTYAKCQDFLGASTYPASDWGEFDDWDDDLVNNAQKLNKYQSLKEEMWRMLALRFDYLRSSNLPGHPVWAAEFQGGPISTGFDKGRVPSAQDIRRWMLTALGSGVNAISFWVARAEIMAPEGNGYSLLDSDGDSTERLSEASRIGKALIKHQDIFGRPSYAGSKVAIFVDEDNFQFCADMPRASENLEFSSRGWHRLLWDAGIPVDFIEASQLDSIDLNQYNAIIMPFPLSVSDKKIKKLGEYVRRGGNLISEAAVTRFTENAYCNRGEISGEAASLFGVKQKSFTMVSEPGNGHRWSPPTRTWGEFREATMLDGKETLSGLKTRANVYLQTFDCTDSKPCLYAGDQIAGTVKSYGKGKTWLFGTYIGHSGTAYKDANTPLFVKSLMKQCAVLPEHEGQLLLRRRKISGKEAWVITNPTDHAVTESFNINDWKTATDLMDQPIAIKDRTVKVSLESLDVSVIILQ